MLKSDATRKKKEYIKPEITSHEVEQDAYACGSTPGDKASWLEWCLLFGCCDHNIIPIIGC